MLLWGVRGGKQEGGLKEYACISEYIFSNHFSYEPIDFYGNLNRNQRKRSFGSPFLFPHSPWPSLIPAPNQHRKRKKSSNNKNPFALWCTQRTHWSENKLVPLLALPCCWEKTKKTPIKTWLVGKGGITLKSFPLFLKTLYSTELELCSDQDMEIIPGWATDTAHGLGIPTGPLRFLAGKMETAQWFLRKAMLLDFHLQLSRGLLWPPCRYKEEESSLYSLLYSLDWTEDWKPNQQCWHLCACVS